jgi:hypothetical protein
VEKRKINCEAFKKTEQAFHILKHLAKRKRKSSHGEPAPTCAPSRMDDM